jgi:hypothetical protein
MPGLLRGVARTAVVAGTATAVSNRVARRQANRWSQQGGTLPPGYAYGYNTQGSAPPEGPPLEAGPDPVEQLRQLAQLRDDGVLTEEEFAAEKRKVLG